MTAPPRTLGQAIQIYNPALERGRLRHALFDFDGTLSLLRAGWQEVMTGYFVEELARTSTAETQEELHQVCRDFITRLTGQQTIYQMFQLETEIRQRGGIPRPVFILGEVELDRWPAERVEDLRRRFPVLVSPRIEVLSGVLAAARAYLGNDSGPSHLAAALGTPTLALFGPTNPRQFAPVGPKVSVLAAETIERITVDEVLHCISEEKGVSSAPVKPKKK